jgi:hypothetical protein
MNVREAFESAFGGVPEGAECYIGVTRRYSGGELVPTIRFQTVPMIWQNNHWCIDITADVLGANIAERFAPEFEGMWSGYDCCKKTGEAYDKAVAWIDYVITTM